MTGAWKRDVLKAGMHSTQIPPPMTCTVEVLSSPTVTLRQMSDWLLAGMAQMVIGTLTR